MVKQRRGSAEMVFGFDGEGVPRAWAKACRLEEAIEGCRKQAAAYVHEKASVGECVTLRLFHQRPFGTDDLRITVGA